MKISDFIKNLITGLWKNGFLALCKVVLEHWILSLLVVVLIVFLCSDSETAIYAWFLIGIFAVYSALKAVVEIVIETIKYIKSENTEEKATILQKSAARYLIFYFV